MIEGLKLDFSSKELQEQIQSRADYHKERGTWYTQQVTALKEGGLERHDATLDPVTGLERQAKEHKEKYALFQTLADHVIPNETYRLTEHDLTRLEFVSRYY